MQSFIMFANCAVFPPGNLNNEASMTAKFKKKKKLLLWKEGEWSRTPREGCLYVCGLHLLNMIHDTNESYVYLGLFIVYEHISASGLLQSPFPSFDLPLQTPDPPFSS